MTDKPPSWMDHFKDGERAKYAELGEMADLANAQRDRIRRLCMARARKAKTTCTREEATSTD